MKRIIVITLLAMVLLGVGCVKIDKLSELTVMTGEINVDYISLDKMEYDLLGDSKDIFKSTFEQYEVSDLKYIKSGEVITLDFGKEQPDKIVIKDDMLDPKGDFIYDDKLTREVQFTEENGKYHFTVEKHLASGLGAVFSETAIDGYRVNAFWGDEEYVYTFVIITDSYMTV